MASTTHLATPEDDRRHAPGPESLPLWNESLWFPFYDPAREIGVVFRVGLLPNQGQANLFVFLAHRGAIVHALVDQHAPIPPAVPGQLELGGLRIDWEVPLERFRLRYHNGTHGFDVRWEATSPAYRYPHPPGVSFDQVPGHLEQGGRARGTVTLGGTAHAVDAFAHRDHSWGGERDWAKFHRWTYLSGELDDGSWFNAVRIDYGAEVDFRIGCLWDGRELLDLARIDLEVATADGGARQRGVTARLTDERGSMHEIVGEAPVVICPVRYGQTWLKDGFTRWRCGAREGWGIHEHGYVEG